MNPVWKLIFFLFNIEGYGEFFSGITPKTLHFAWVILFIKVNCRTRRAWRYQRDIQNPYIEEEQTKQWPTEQVQKDKQRSAKHTYKTKDRVTRTPLKTVGELRCPGRVNSSCITLVAHFVHYKGEQFSLIQSKLSMAGPRCF